MYLYQANSTFPQSAYKPKHSSFFLIIGVMVLLPVSLFYTLPLHMQFQFAL